MALQIFPSLYDAKVAGFEPYDRSPLVFIVRKQTVTGWELAIVQFTLEPKPNE